MGREFARARSAENKAKRRTQLLESAKIAIRESGLEAVKMDEVASQAGIAKSAFYKYFSSKDELFAHVLLAEMEAITVALGARQSELVSIDRLAEIIARECAARPECCALIASLARTLDRNVPGERLVEVKRGFAQSLHDWSEIISSAPLSFEKREAEQLAKGLYALVSGLWPLTRDRPEVKAAAREAEFSATFGEFENELRFHVLTLARGIASGAE